MISISLRHSVTAVAMMLAATATAGPLVVRANGPSAASFKPGQRLADATPVVLRVGDQLTILDARGTRSLTGPGNFRFDQPVADSAAPSAFAELLTQRPERRARIGAVRSTIADPTAIATPPGVWALDAAASGTVCTLNPAQISLWRADPTKAVTLTVTRIADGQSAPVAFAAGQATAPWPVPLTPTDKAQFRVAGGKAPAKLVVRHLTAAPTSLDALGAALIENGCQSQFDRLAKATVAAN